MRIETEKLLKDLEELTLSHIEFAKSLLPLSSEELNFRLNEKSWSVLECYAHLNLYGDFYLPEIEKQIAASSSSPEKIFKAGVLGNYFAQTMLPKEKLNTMKTFKVMDPIYSKLDINTLLKFIHQCEKMIELFQKARKVSLIKTKTAISISKLIKLRLGDTFRVVINHNERHQEQVKRVLKG